MPDIFTPTQRSKVRRLPTRGGHERARIYEMLDSALLCHVGYVIDGQPYVTPTSYWRVGDDLYWHGSSASRMLRTQSAGIPVCLTAVHFDGLVIARSGFHSSINYRSVMAFGKARKIEAPEEKLAALEAFIDRLLPGHGPKFRQPTTQEVKGTSVLTMAIEEASLKVRTGPPSDEAEDYDLPIWAGVVPIRQMVEAPIADPRLLAGIAVPEALGHYEPGRTFDAALSAAHPDRRKGSKPGKPVKLPAD